MKKEYISPKAEVVVFVTDDVVTTSSSIVDLSAPELPFIFFD